jgi:hypothetical protein
MQHWQSYVRAGWEIVTEAQGISKTYLQSDVEAFLVHTIARTFERTDIWEEPIAIKLMSAQTKPGLTKRIELRSVGEECLFIDAWEIKQRRWPSPRYFQEMGSIAFGMASIATEPVDKMLELVSTNFGRMSQVLRTARNLAKM